MQPGPPQPPPMPYSPPQFGYPYPPPYYVPPRRDDTRLILIVVVVVVIILVVVPIVIAAALYVMVSGLVGGPDGGPRTMDVTISRTVANWTLTVSVAPSGLTPANTFLQILDDQGNTALAQVSWSSLTPGTWAIHNATYEDGNPGIAEIAAGDALILDRGTYPAGDLVQFSSAGSLLWVGTLN